jgi:hypothetical protein
MSHHENPRTKALILNEMVGPDVLSFRNDIKDLTPLRTKTTRLKFQSLSKLPVPLSGGSFALIAEPNFRLGGRP